MTANPYTKNALSSLSGTIVDRAAHFGSLPLDVSAFEVFFKDKNQQAHSMNLANATPDQLETLAKACSVAPFGRGGESVVDDTYRKAGKLDLPNFAIPFEPEGTALMRGIRVSVLGGKDSKRPIRFELYKLNIYGEGGFFKAHKDTPRGGNMFGSLVLVYPTTHSGGALVFRHQGRELTFDSAASVNQEGTPAFGYAAFFSDVEHEVLPVTSGYRVTITYNLYFDDVETTQPTADPTLPILSDFADQLERLLDDPQFLPDGGYLGFGLRHEYPVEFAHGLYPAKRGVQHIKKTLKGSDAIVLHAAQAAGLSTQLHVAHKCRTDFDQKVMVLTTDVLGGDDYVENGLWRYLTQSRQGVSLWPEGEDGPHRPERAVHWVTRYAGATRVKSTFVAYGNEASIDYAYSVLCLLVAVGPAGARKGKKNLCRDSKDNEYDAECERRYWERELNWRRKEREALKTSR